jgi:hypothetical protein
MNRLILIAAIAMGFTAAIHLIGGEVSVHRPLLADATTPEMDIYVSVIWHGISAMIVLNTLALVAALRTTTPVMLTLIGAQTLAVGLLFILYGLIRTGSPWIAPQWVILVPLGLFILRLGQPRKQMAPT